MSQRTSSNSPFSLNKSSDIDSSFGEELTGSIVSVGVDGFLHFAGLSDFWNSPQWLTTINELSNDAEQKKLKHAWSQAKGETSQYRPFCGWMDVLIPLLIKPQRASRRDIKFLPLNTTRLSATPGFADGNEVPGTASGFQPDAVCVLKDVALSNWGHVLVPLEFRYTARGLSTPKSTSATRIASSTSTSLSLDVPGPSEPSSSQDPPTTTTRKPRGPVTSHLHSGPTTSAPKPDSPISPNYKPTGDGIQLARYAMETLAAVGDRTHVFGMAVNRPEIVLWYFDRCGAVRSPALNVEHHEDFLAFVKFLSAIIYMENDALGFNPFFANATEANPGVQTNLCNSFVDIPDRGDLSLKLLKVLDRRTGLVCRATLVFRAELGKDGTTEEVVLKSSWQHVTRKSESEILKLLHSSGQAKDYIVGFHHGWDQKGATGSFQRARFGESAPIVAHDRALRHTITEYLNPITELSRPFHIPHIGWSVLQAIKFLNSLGWFHRDISIGNMGFAMVQPCNGVLVKLHDFDLSKEHGSASGAPHWTGTLPFMSIELLTYPDMEHKIGFDVEALIWTLLWIVRVYTDGRNTFKVAKDHPLQNWFSNVALADIGSNKHTYLRMVGDFTNQWYAPLENELRELVLEWYEMREAQQKLRRKMNQPRLLCEDVYGLEGLLRIENWMRTTLQRWDVPRNTCPEPCGRHCARN
ncbi:hypothetical protein M407DRAFT_27022 [Tulasnella calospora MUT 4182]|uniref:Protein kinase domain-containing protein n=1 Tax=Tulasnella calospora MUT 4182 TaxID=1051891 RepID=A0A0C3QEL9_9AGAM|nr:hypothetical protein M407DRAFT_27022 [Tulasnella calospora MUT 4182]